MTPCSKTVAASLAPCYSPSYEAKPWMVTAAGPPGFFRYPRFTLPGSSSFRRELGFRFVLLEIDLWLDQQRLPNTRSRPYTCQPTLGNGASDMKRDLIRRQATTTKRNNQGGKP